MTYAVITMFGVVVAILGPAPYTMEECIDSLSVLTLPVELEADAHCVFAEDKPELGKLTDEQVQRVNEWTASQDTHDER